MSSSWMFIFIHALLVDVMESITHDTIFRLVTTNIAPLRIGPPWQDGSHVSCIVTCRETYPTCQSVLFNPHTGKCTPGSTLVATSPLPSPDEGEMYVFIDPTAPLAAPSTLASSVTSSSSSTTLSTNTVLTTTVATESSSATDVSSSTTPSTTTISTTTNAAPSSTTQGASENSTSTSTIAYSTSTIPTEISTTVSTTESSASQTSTTEISTTASSTEISTTTSTTASTTEFGTTAGTAESSTVISCTDAGLAYHVYNNITYCIRLFISDASFTEHIDKCTVIGSKTVRITTADKLQMLHTISGGTDFWFGCSGYPDFPYRWLEGDQELSDFEYTLLFPPWEKDKTFFAGSCCQYSASNGTAYVVDCAERASFVCEL